MPPKTQKRQVSPSTGSGGSKRQRVSFRVVHPDKRATSSKTAVTNRIVIHSRDNGGRTRLTQKKQSTTRIVEETVETPVSLASQIDNDTSPGSLDPTPTTDHPTTPKQSKPRKNPQVNTTSVLSC